MIRIYKNNDTKLVTKGAYENTFKHLGYKVVIEAKVEEPVKPKVETKEAVANVKEKINEDSTKVKKPSKPKYEDE